MWVGPQAVQARLQQEELKLLETRRAQDAAEAEGRAALASERQALASARQDAHRQRERADGAEAHLRTAASNLGAGVASRPLPTRACIPKAAL